LEQRIKIRFRDLENKTLNVRYIPLYQVGTTIVQSRGVEGFSNPIARIKGKRMKKTHDDRDSGRAYFHTSYLYILKHFETFPHIYVKIRSPVWLSLFSHQEHKAGKRITESSHHLGTTHSFGSGFGSGL
jgi:hypothetical protein